MGSRALTRWTSLLLGSVVLVGSVGCHSTTNPTPTLQTDTFTGTLEKLGTVSRNFDVQYALTVSDASLTVTSMTTVADGTPVTTTIGIGFGSIAFDGSCSRSTTYSANTANIGQELIASGVFSNATYCFQIYDLGTLTEPINWTVVVKHY
jgi:hypothetical protein